MNAAELMSTVLRFWSKVDKSGDCWEWTGARHSFGYGFFSLWLNGGCERILAHRLSLMLVGVPVGESDKVLHSCDNPPCVNPSHLSVGTQRDNIHDALNKGRLNLAGLTADTPIICRECGTCFMGFPSRFYCDECKPKTRAREQRVRRANRRSVPLSGKMNA